MKLEINDVRVLRGDIDEFDHCLVTAEIVF